MPQNTSFQICLPLESSGCSPDDHLDQNDTISLELSGDPRGVQVNILQEGMMHNRLAISMENGRLVLKVWEPGSWSGKEPAEERILWEERPVELAPPAT